MYKGRKLLIATKHQKEKVIADKFEVHFGVKCFVEPTYDTDKLGTFTGEVERTLSPIETLRAKCFHAMNTYEYDLGIASEGSFGPHPAIFMIPADEELMIFIDKKNDVEIVVKQLSTKTNFAGKRINSLEALDQFIQQIKFPSHGVILRKDRDSNENIIKDINDYANLKAAFIKLMDLYGTVFIETDMRAMNNPTRMSVIEETAIKLIHAIDSKCPECQTPGFLPIKFIPGLPCGFCGLPTKSIKSEIIGCKKCGFEQEVKFPKNKKIEDPQYCDYCNP
jgi:hypothetical protein